MDLGLENYWYLSGATAVGKTSVGIELARKLNAEIISLDSMSIYRGMDIGTAKPTPQEQEEVPHHLIDIVDPWEEYSLAQYLEAASRTVEEIRGREREVLFVGGTALYLKSLLRGFCGGPPANWELRNAIIDELAQVGQEALHRRLVEIDPVAAANIHPNDTRRLIRALEVYRATGEPLSHQQLEFEEGRSAEACRVFVLRRERIEQRARIDRRVTQMLENGLVEEVRGLLEHSRGLGRTARQAVGYAEVIELLAGRQNLEWVEMRMGARSRQFAKRQGTWFRGLSECRFVDLDGEVDPGEVAQQIAAAV